MSPLTIDITVQQHQALKAMAALEGKSIKYFAIEIRIGKNWGQIPIVFDLEGIQG